MVALCMLFTERTTWRAGGFVCVVFVIAAAAAAGDCEITGKESGVFVLVCVRACLQFSPESLISTFVMALEKPA